MSWDWLAPLATIGGAAVGTFFGAPTVGAAVGGALGSSISNSMAGSQAQKAQRQGAQIEADAIDRANQQLGAYREEQRPGENYLRQVVASPGDLTPAQKLQLEDLRRSEGNAIRTSSLAGSGRAAASLLRDSEIRFTTGALDTNRRRADTAAEGMASRAGNTVNAMAGNTVKSGSVLGSAERNAGTIGAMTTLANGEQATRAIGAIASQARTDARPSRYGEAGNYGGSPEKNPNLNPATYGNMGAESW